MYQEGFLKEVVLQEQGEQGQGVIQEEKVMSTKQDKIKESLLGSGSVTKNLIHLFDWLKCTAG